MLRKLISAAALMGVLVASASADSIWVGTASNSWLDPLNWTAGAPGVTVTNQRANIESTTDLPNWPTIHSGETVTTGQRVQAPLTVPGVGQTMYSRLTIENGGTLNATSDFRMADTGGAGATQPTVASLNVAGTLTLGGRVRFGDSSFTTVDVNVTGTMSQTNSAQDFRIGTGASSTATFGISGSGLVSSTSSTFQIGAGGAVNLSDNGTLTVAEAGALTKPAILTLLWDYVNNGRLNGLTDTYSGAQSLTAMANGVAYYEGANSLSFVASTIPEPSSAVLVCLFAFAVASRSRSRKG